MSKKTRKKSSTPSSKTSAAKKAVRSTAKAPAKAAKSKGQTKAKAKPATKSSKPAKAVAPKTKPAIVKDSHKGASKPLKLKPSAAEMPPAKAGIEGGKAPGFRLPRDGGETVSLADYAGQKLVLFFYPRADTPGCTREAIDFTRLKDDFAAARTAVLGVSADTVKAQESFRAKHELAVPLISDERHEMLEAYGAWGEKSMYGRSFMGIIRTTVLIGADGRIARIWRNVRVDGHAEEVLEAARALAG